jgi:hypothetical protein
MAAHIVAGSAAFQHLPQEAHRFDDENVSGIYRTLSISPVEAWSWI